MAIIPDGLKGIFPQAVWDSMSDKDRKQAISGLGKYMSEKLAAAKPFNELNEQAFDKETLGTISDVATMRIQDANALTAAMRNLVAEGAFFAPDSDFNKGLAHVIKQQNKMFAQPQEGAKAYAALALNLQQFNKLTGDAFNKAGSFTGKLADQAATLKKLGLGIQDFTQNLDTAIYDLGMGQQGVEGFNLSIKQLADDLDMLPQQVSQNFRQIAKTLMYESSMIKEEYAKLELLAQKTGMSATQIASQFGGSMDTIGGASSAAANLNAMLGRNAFSATQLLGMTESERAEAVREAIQADSTIMADIQAGGVQGKFALKSVAEAMGMSGADARRFIQTGDADSVRAQIEKGIKEDPKVGTMDKKILVENFKNPAKNLEAAINKLTEQFDLTIGPQRAAQLGIRRQMREVLDDGQVSEFEMLGQLKSIGFLSRGVSTEQAQAIRQDPAAASLFQEVQERTQLKLVSEEESSRIAKMLSSGDEEERRMGRMAAQRIRKTSIGQQLAQEIEKLDLIKDPIAMSVVNMLNGMTSYGGRIMLGKVIESMRDPAKPLPGGPYSSPQEAKEALKAKAQAIDTATGKDTYGEAISALEDTELASEAQRESARITQEQQAASRFKQSKLQEETSAELDLLRRGLSSPRTAKSARDSAASGMTTVNVHVGDEMVLRLQGHGMEIEKLKTRQSAVERTAGGR